MSKKSYSKFFIFEAIMIFAFVIFLLAINQTYAMNQAKVQTMSLQAAGQQPNSQTFQTNFIQKKMICYGLKNFNGIAYDRLYCHLEWSDKNYNPVIIYGSCSKLDLVHTYGDYMYHIKLSEISYANLEHLKARISDLFNSIAKSIESKRGQVIIFFDELDIVKDAFLDEQDKKSILIFINELNSKLFRNKYCLHTVLGISNVGTVELYKSLFSEHLIVPFDAQIDYKKYIDYHFKRDEKPIFKIDEFNDLILQLRSILAVSSDFKNMLDFINEIETNIVVVQDVINAFYQDNTNLNVKNYANFSMSYKHYQEIQQHLKELIHHEKFPSVFREIMGEKFDLLNHLIQNYLDVVDTYLFKEYYYPSTLDFEYIREKAKKLTLKQLEVFALQVYNVCFCDQSYFKQVTRKVIDENLCIAQKTVCETDICDLQKLEQESKKLKEKEKAQALQTSKCVPSKVNAYSKLVKKIESFISANPYTCTALAAVTATAICYNLYEYLYKKKKNVNSDENETQVIEKGNRLTDGQMTALTLIVLLNLMSLGRR